LKVCTGGLSRALYARVWRGVQGPSIPRKMNLGLAEKMKFAAVLRGLLALFLYRSSITFSVPHPSPSLSMQIWTNYKTHIFEKWGGTCSIPPVAPLVRAAYMHYMLIYFPAPVAMKWRSVEKMRAGNRDKTNLVRYARISTINRVKSTR